MENHMKTKWKLLVVVLVLEKGYSYIGIEDKKIEATIYGETYPKSNARSIGSDRII